MSDKVDVNELKRMVENCKCDPEKTTSLLNKMPFAAMMISKGRKLLAVNDIAESIGVKVGTNCWHTFGKLASIPEKDKEFFEQHEKPPEGGTKCTFCKADEALQSGAHISVKLSVDGTDWNTNWLPLNDDLYLHYAIDVTTKE